MPTPHQESRYFSEQLQTAMTSTTQPDGRKWTDRTLAEAVEATGVTVSRHYIHALRIGQRRNPRISLVDALAHVLGLPVTYFTEYPDPVTGRLSADNALDNVELRQLAGILPELPRSRRQQLLDLARRLRDDNRSGIQLPSRDGDPSTPQPDGRTDRQTQ